MISCVFALVAAITAAMPPEVEVVAEGSLDSLHCDPDSDALAEPS